MVNDKPVTGPKHPTKLIVSLMRTACIQEKGILMTLFGTTFPQAPSLSLQCFHPGATAFIHTSMLPEHYSHGRHTCQTQIILARSTIISLGGLQLKEESICTLKCRFCFLPPRSSPVMTCCCNTCNYNTFSIDFSEQREDSLWDQPGRPQQPPQGFRVRTSCQKNFQNVGCSGPTSTWKFPPQE